MTAEAAQDSFSSDQLDVTVAWPVVRTGWAYAACLLHVTLEVGVTFVATLQRGSWGSVAMQG